MLQESKSLQTKKHYLSNYNIRVASPDIQIQSESKQLTSQLSCNRTNNRSVRQKVLNPNFTLGDVDTLFLTRQNERIQQEMLQLISEIQTSHCISAAELQRSSWLESQLETYRSKNQRMQIILRRLLETSGGVVELVRQKCKIVGFLAKIIQQLKCSQWHLKRTIEQKQRNREQLEIKCLALEKKLKYMEEIRLDRANQEIQTQCLKHCSNEVQTQAQQTITHEHSSQTYIFCYNQQQIQASVSTSQKETNSPVLQYKHQVCATTQISSLQFGLQIGSSTAFLQELAQQTQKNNIEQIGTQTESAKLIQQQLRNLQIMISLPKIKNQTIKQNYGEIATQTEIQIAKQRINSYKFSIQNIQMIKIQPRVRQFFNKQTQASTKPVQKQIQVQKTLRSQIFCFWSMEEIKIEPHSKHLLHQSTQTSIKSVQKCIQTQKKQYESIEIMTLGLQFDHRAIQVQIQIQQVQTQNQISIIDTNLQRQEAFGKPKKLSIMEQFSLVVEQRQQVKFQTEVTQQEDAALKMSFADKQVSQNIISYIKKISSMQNQISYNEQIVKDLQKNGQNEASKALARLLKEHMYLKVCLNRMIDKQREQRQNNNQKIISLFEDKQQPMEKTHKDGQPAENQCTIY